MSRFPASPTAAQLSPRHRVPWSVSCDPFDSSVPSPRPANSPPKPPLTAVRVHLQVAVRDRRGHRLRLRESDGGQLRLAAMRSCQPVRTTGRRPRRRRRRCRRPERPRRACWPTSPLRRRACCCNVGGQERPLLGRWRSPGPLVTRSSRRREVCGSHDRQPTVPVCSTACGRPPGDSQRGRPCRRALASPARHGIRTAPRRRGGSRMPAPGRYQRPWITVPLCNVTTFLALPVQSMKAGRSRQVSRASLQCSTTPAGDA